MPKRRFWSLNQVARYLQVSREGVLLLELDDAGFPRHFTDDADRAFWDADELDEWAEKDEWFEPEDEDANEDEED